MKVAIIGAGNLGQSIAKGLLSNKAVKPIYLTKRNLSSLGYFKNYKEVVLTSNNTEAVVNSDIVIFAVQPKYFENILKNIKPLLIENQILISVIAGFNISKIEEIIGLDKIIIRAMPNTATCVKQSMTCISSNQKGKEKLSQAINIFNNLGISVEVPENN